MAFTPHQFANSILEVAAIQTLVRLRGLMQNQRFQPDQAGFACVAATSSARYQLT
ncbi:hypothetical protein [Nostoc sp.]|uniref:hypothetical protein n=1 Tax=Nostoc sp. TaxID=1180 RepID=UPI002FFC81AF